MYRAISYRWVLVAALTAFERHVAAKSYTSNSTTVDVTIDYLDAFGSSKKCVKYMTNKPIKYDMACFTTIYTDGGAFSDCEVTFGDYSCNSCARCNTEQEEVGYTIDCFNIQPAETTPLCVLMNDTNIQEVLVDTTFASQAFSFSDNSTTPESGDGGATGGGGGNITTGASSLQVSTAIYTSGITRVNVTTELLDEFGSNEKCVRFLSNKPENYDMACFTTIYTDGGAFSECKVTFGDDSCNSCARCNTEKEEVGYTIDCFNIQPAETTPLCVLMTDANIQEVLVDTDFASQSFSFSDNSTTPESGDGGATEVGLAQENSSSAPAATPVAVAQENTANAPSGTPAVTPLASALENITSAPTLTGVAVIQKNTTSAPAASPGENSIYIIIITAPASDSANSNGAIAAPTAAPDVAAPAGSSTSGTTPLHATRCVITIWMTTFIGVLAMVS